MILFRNPVYSAVSLILSFITSGFLWLLLQAEFLAIVLILVYVGAVMVLFLFVIMMLNINNERDKSSFNSLAPFALFIGLIIAAELITLIWINSSQFNINSLSIQEPDQVSNTLALGKELFTNYILSFEIAGSMATRTAVDRCSPVVLEPVMKLEVVTPEDYLGEVIGDLGRRRAGVESIDAQGDTQIVKASLPLAESFGFHSLMCLMSN